MFTFSSDIEFVPSVSNKILGSAPKQTNKQTKPKINHHFGTKIPNRR